jgi:hypothetical protein
MPWTVVTWRHNEALAIKRKAPQGAFFMLHSFALMKLIDDRLIRK